MRCNYCGSSFHSDNKCLMQLFIGYGLTENKFFPTWYEINKRQEEGTLETELFKRWIKGLKMKKLAKKNYVPPYDPADGPRMEEIRTYYDRRNYPKVSDIKRESICKEYK